MPMIESPEPEQPRDEANEKRNDILWSIVWVLALFFLAFPVSWFSEYRSLRGRFFDSSSSHTG